MARNGFQLESPNHALSDDIFHGLKYDDLYLTISWRHHNMTFSIFFTLEMIKTPIQASVQSLVKNV